MSSDSSWIPSLQLQTESIDQEPRLPSGDWLQDDEYPDPLWTATAADLARRVSIQNFRQLYALQLISSERDEAHAPLLSMGDWSRWRHYRIGLAEAWEPIEDGFLRRLRLWREKAAPEQPVDPTVVVREFLLAERARIGDMEKWLVRRYRGNQPAGDVFRWIDFPAFDNGALDLGFALLLHGPELHVWSRVVHAHK